MKLLLIAGALTAALLLPPCASMAADNSEMAEVQAKDFKTFKVPENVSLYRVSFDNQYGMRLAGYLFMPKDLKGKEAAIIVGHPMGASKEQAASVYAAQLAGKGFVTLALDQQFWGESGGRPRHGIAPDLYAEAFMAAVDFLGTRDFVDPEKIGVLGVCGSGSFVISAAKIDPRMKAVATVSMYNIGEMRRNGINNSQSLDQRKKMIADAAKVRFDNFLGKERPLTGGAPFSIKEDSPAPRKASYDFYRGRGEFLPKGEKPEDNTRSDQATNAHFMNFYPFNDIETISPRPMLFIMGEKAHSQPFTIDAYAKAAEPKELVVIPGANHFDLYDKLEVIPTDKLAEFFRSNLK